ncbi:MAG: hypothetical protein ACLQUR_11425 [Limisphaerales bacterium]
MVELRRFLTWFTQKAVATGQMFGDLFHGSTITEVRHKTSIPILLVRAQKK